MLHTYMHWQVVGAVVGAPLGVVVGAYLRHTITTGKRVYTNKW